MSGTEIVSSAAVAVFAGNLNNAPSSTFGTSANQQMLPASSAGTTYAVAAPLPDTELQEYNVRIVALNANTRVSSEFDWLKVANVYESRCSTN